MPYNFDPLGYSATPSSPSERKILSVSDLNRQAKRLLEVSFPSVWIEGELSNIARPPLWPLVLYPERCRSPDSLRHVPGF